MGPIGFPLVPGWFYVPGVGRASAGQGTMLPGGMLATIEPNVFIMIVAGWYVFAGTPPL